MKKAVLAVWTDVVPEAEAEFNEWYTREHVASRVDLPGFFNGFRYCAAEGSPKYFAWYETESERTLKTPEYEDVLENPSAWTQRIMPSFRNMIRCVFQIRYSLGRGRGGFAAIFRLPSTPGRDPELTDWLINTAMPSAAKMPGIVGAHLWELDAEATLGPVAEIELRGAPDATVERALLVEGVDASSVQGTCQAWFSLPSLQERGAGPDLAMGLYRFLYGLGF